jgi:multisubunit Na+/H+ antiporter MnhG subunit
MQALIIVMGLIGILIGVLAYVGLYPRLPQVSPFKGRAPASFTITGVGAIVLGVAGIYRAKEVGLVGLVIVVLGIVLGFISPSWLVPGWYKEQHPDSPPPH